jgi:broad specificity phosphatase PhoE
MTRIVLVRPGATDYDLQGRIVGNLNLPLSEAGKVQTKALIDGLAGDQVSAIYTLPSQSAVETAETIADVLGAKVTTLERFTNLDLGLWQGMLEEEVRTKQPKAYRQWQEQPETLCPPGGEMLVGLRNRARTALTKILKRHKTGTVVLVAPEPAASVVVSEFKKTDLGNLWKAAQSFGNWETIPIEGDAPAGIR